MSRKLLIRPDTSNQTGRNWVQKGETIPVSWSAYLTLLQAVKNWPGGIAREVSIADANTSIQDAQCRHFSCKSTHCVCTTFWNKIYIWIFHCTKKGICLVILCKALISREHPMKCCSILAWCVVTFSLIHVSISSQLLMYKGTHNQVSFKRFKGGQRRDKGTGADGVDAQNKRLEVRHNV